MFFEGLGDLIGGSIEGGGLAEGLLGLARGLGQVFFEGGSSELAAGLFRGGAAGEGILSRVFGLLDVAADRYIDYLCFKDVLGKGQGQSWGDFRKNWDNISSASRDEIEGLRQVIKGHSFIRQQLTAHESEPGVSEILNEYKALGLNLPSEDLLKKSYRKLSGLFHPDTHPGIDAELQKELNIGNDAIGHATKRAFYERTLQENPQGVEKLFNDLGKVDWQEVYGSAARKSHLLLSGPVGSKYAAASNWISDLKPSAKTGLFFGTVAAVSLGSYGLAKIAEHKRQRRKALQMQRQDEGAPAAHQQIEQSRREATGGTAAGIV